MTVLSEPSEVYHNQKHSLTKVGEIELFFMDLQQRQSQGATWGQVPY